MAANVDVDSMGVKAMKELIRSAGLSHADCCEKADLRNRSREALARLAEAKARRPAPAPGAPETATFGTWPTIVKYANGATRESHDLVVVMLHGVNAPPDDLVPLCDPMGQLLGGTRCVFAFPSAGPQCGSTPAFGDLDGDGDLDLVVGDEDGTLFYYENAGSAASPSYEARTGNDNPFDDVDVGRNSAPAFGDLDGDGDLDLVESFDGIDGGDYSRPAIGDLDGDGDLVLVVGVRNGDLYYYEIEGPAVLPSYVACAAASLDGIDASFVDEYGKPALGDIDGDGDLDLVVGEFDGGLSYYENVGSAASPTYAGRRRDANPFDGIDVGTDSAGRGFSTPALVDLDGDGDLDLVLGEEEGVLNYYENVGSATSPTYAVVSGDANPFDGIDVGSYSAPAFSDLDGDSDLDLVVGRDAGVLNYYENVGSAASPSYVAVTGNENPFDGIDVSGLWDSSAPALDDIDGDGDLDLIVGANGFSTSSRTCLGGFDHEVPGVVEQCGECQAGFYGKTCEPCPQGGNEDRNAPRLTDTCGIAGSGRSRGSCDDGIRGDGTCACFGDVFSGSGCTNGTCPAGTVENATFDGYYNNAACTPCDAGTFSAEGDDECTKCASGKFSAGRASECAICSAGSYSGPGANVCSSCAIRTYQDETGSPNCKLADAGFFVDSLGASEQTACDAGKYSGSAASECIACEAGTYQGATGEVSCALADAGFFVDSLGASKQVACDAGKYSGSGAKACIDCEAGTYQGAIGESSCKIAEAGSFVDVAGASRQRPCPAGSFSGSAASECVDCEAGTYVPRSGAVAAVIADAGYVVETSDEGSATCAPVDAGLTNAELSTITFEVGTGLVLSGLAVRFPDDDAAREAFASAVREIVNAPGGGAVFDVSAEDVHLSAGRVMEYTKTFYQDTVRTALLDSIESGDAQRAFDRQDATGTSLASVVVDEASSLAMVRGETAVEIGKTYCDACIGDYYWDRRRVVGVVVRRFGVSEVWTNAVNVFREVAKGEAPEDIATEKMEEEDESAANEALEEAETAFLSAARRCFDMIDADGSGTLTRMEIAEAVAGNDEVVEFLRTCGDDNLRLLLEPGRIDVALHVLDPSGDGAIDADEWEAAVQRGPGACLDGQGEAAAKRGAVTKLKIVIATYQIVTSITWTLPQVRFPAAFDRMLKLFSFVNLSLISFAKPECFGSFRYFDKLVFVTLIPPVVLFAIAAAAALRCSCVARERRPGVVDAAWYWSLFALYVLVPSTSSYCLRYFACLDYEGGYGDDISILQIDPMIACTSNSWKRAWMPYAVIAIFVYPVGVPLGFARRSGGCGA
ncbi:calcium ion binding protein [Aureococcus anophagefferens]|nr:calcium ion binding protein [Aureococcus anophagefferens]